MVLRVFLGLVTSGLRRGVTQGSVRTLLRNKFTFLTDSRRTTKGATSQRGIKKGGGSASGVFPHLFHRRSFFRLEIKTLGARSPSYHYEASAQDDNRANGGPDHRVYAREHSNTA